MQLLTARDVAPHITCAINAFAASEIIVLILIEFGSRVCAGEFSCFDRSGRNYCMSPITTTNYLIFCYMKNVKTWFLLENFKIFEKLLMIGG